MEMHDQPTVPKQDDVIQGRIPVAPEATTLPNNTARHSRRKFFTLAALGVAGAGGAATAGGIVLSKFWQPAFPSGGVPDAARIGHLLRRAGFGARPVELQTYAASGFEGTIERLLNYQQVPDDEMENRLKTIKLDFNKLQDQQRWWLLRMAWTQRPLLEKMTLFWHGLLTSSYRKVGGKDAFERMIVQNQFLRDYAFDTFDVILQGITRDPAMLVYLDLTKSRKSAPNENYARELMELFTLGSGHYTQQDVQEAAAALTGWHVVGKESTSRYLPRDRANRTIHFLGQSGTFNDQDIIRILANHEATPWFLCRKLYTFFVHENPGEADLKPLVETYIKSKHSIREVMRTLLLSPQFSAGRSYRSRVKSPAEFVVGAYRALNVQGEGVGLSAAMAVMGQSLFDPPNVAGWPGDKVSAVWLNSGTWMTRMNYIDALLAGSRNAGGPYKPLDLQAIVTANHIDTPDHFVDFFASFLLDGVLDKQRRTQLIEYFNGKEPAGRSTQQSVVLANGKSYPLNRVRGTLYLLMASPEYQLN
jgi:uncharacterized protein (DUF1800 family)